MDNDYCDVWIMRSPDGTRQIVGSTQAGLKEYFDKGWVLDPKEETDAVAEGVRKAYASTKIKRTESTPVGDQNDPAGDV